MDRAQAGFGESGDAEGLSAAQILSSTDCIELSGERKVPVPRGLPSFLSQFLEILRSFHIFFFLVLLNKTCRIGRLKSQLSLKILLEIR